MERKIFIQTNGYMFKECKGIRKDCKKGVRVILSMMDLSCDESINILDEDFWFFTSFEHANNFAEMMSFKNVKLLEFFFEEIK